MGKEGPARKLEWFPPLESVPLSSRWTSSSCSSCPGGVALKDSIGNGHVFAGAKKYDLGVPLRSLPLQATKTDQNHQIRGSECSESVAIDAAMSKRVCCSHHWSSFVTQHTLLLVGEEPSFEVPVVITKLSRACTQATSMSSFQGNISTCTDCTAIVTEKHLKILETHHVASSFGTKKENTKATKVQKKSI